MTTKISMLLNLQNTISTTRQGYIVSIVFSESTEPEGITSHNLAIET
jgi:hypothetical protein